MSILFSPPWYCACHRLKVIGQVAVGGKPQTMSKDKHISLLSCLFQLFGSEKSDEDPVVIVYVKCPHLSGQLLHQTLSTFTRFPLSTFLTSALQLHWPLSISLSLIPASFICSFCLFLMALPYHSGSNIKLPPVSYWLKEPLGSTSSWLATIQTKT